MVTCMGDAGRDGDEQMDPTRTTGHSGQTRVGFNVSIRESEKPR